MKQRIRLLARALKYRYKLDPAEVRFLLDTVKPGDSVMDLGAHKGAYTYWIAKAAGTSGKVVAVEPQRNLADKLVRLMEAKPNIEVRWAAMSDSTGTGTLSLRLDGSSHGASINGFPDGEIGNTVEVPTITLADLMVEQKMDRLDFIKCDVEGYEGEVFAASTETITKYRPTILIEWDERLAKGEFGGIAGMRKIFEPLNYRMRFFRGGELRPLSAFDADKHQNYGHGEYCNNFVLDDPNG